VNSFGKRFSFTTFGESHGKAIGCVVDGVPAGILIDETFLQSELDRRRPGKNEFATARSESDKVEILSGVFDGYSTGTPIALIIYNQDQKSRDYSSIKDLFRPSHADFTYYHKYGIRDYRGGGRSSARETAARVAAGGVAKLMLKEMGIDIRSGIVSIGEIESKQIDYEYAKSSPIYALDKSQDSPMQKVILDAKNDHDSVGGVVQVSICNLPIGLGEPIYYKLDALLADAMMSINASKAVEIGDGMLSAKKRGSQNNDQMNKDGFLSNHSGGILGGISSGDEVLIRVHFKPTPSIFKDQHSITTDGKDIEFSLKGRHDPCVAIRGSIVCEAMAALVVADLLLLNMGSDIKSVTRYYSSLS